MMEYVTRQVRRQRERLAAKGRTDVPPAYLMGNRFPSRHPPYTAKQLMDRAIERLRLRRGGLRFSA